MSAGAGGELLESIRAKPKTVLAKLTVENGIGIDTARTHLQEQSYSSRSCHKKPILPPSIVAGTPRQMKRRSRPKIRWSCSPTIRRYIWERMAGGAAYGRYGQLILGILSCLSVPLRLGMPDHTTQSSRWETRIDDIGQGSKVQGRRGTR